MCSSDLLKKGDRWQVRFLVRADESRPLRVRVVRRARPFENRGLDARIQAEPDWKKHRLAFSASADEIWPEISFQLGESEIPCEIADLSVERIDR